MKPFDSNVLKTCLFVLLVLLFIELPGDLSAADRESDAARGIQVLDQFRIEGYVSAKCVARTASLPNYDAEGNGESETFNDSDVFGHLRLDVTMPRQNDFEFHFFAVGRKDLDGNQQQEGFNPFEGIGDTQETSLGQVYEAHFDINHWIGFTQIRLGRQAGTRGEWIYFDGLSADLKTSQSLGMTLYAGQPVHFDETDPGTDFLGGLGIDLSPFPQSKMQADWLYAKDQRSNRIEFYDETGNPVPFDDRNDMLVSLKWWQTFTSYSKAMVKFRWINSKQRDMAVRSINLDLVAGIDLFVNYSRQFLVQHQLSNETSVFFDVLGKSEPYQTLEVKTRKQFGDDYGLDLGAFRKQLVDQGTESTFNREFGRYYAVFEAYDLGLESLTLSLTQELWDSKTYNGSSSGLDLEYKLSPYTKSTRLNMGTYYSLYKYDYYLEVGERTKVQTVYLKAKVPFLEKYTVNVGYELEMGGDYENDGTEKFQTLKMAVRRDF
ncbi:MAG: hypothetical protein GY866_27730 [Proteobacteria bacterium]|nr:hypothetical protein [Pseudomonadota bacterium]